MVSLARGRSQLASTERHPGAGARAATLHESRVHGSHLQSVSRPRQALWIAAALGDVTGVRRLIARKGVLKAAGRLNRPDPLAVGCVLWWPSRHDADDLEIMWEAFMIAGPDEPGTRWTSCSRQELPVDHAPVVWPSIMEAVGNQRVSLVGIIFVSRGAELDRGVRWGGSVRKMARSHVENMQDPHDPK